MRSHISNSTRCEQHAHIHAGHPYAALAETHVTMLLSSLPSFQIDYRVSPIRNSDGSRSHGDPMHDSP